MKRKTSNKKIRRTASNIIMICLIGIIIVCAYNIGTTLYKYHMGQETYKEIAKLASADDKLFNGDIDFDALRKTNPDVIGWIHQYGTPINYPIVQTTDNDKYLHTMFNGEYGGGGTLFADCNVAKPFEDFNTIVYGHHMRDGSMFKSLKNYKDPEYVKENNTFDLVTLNGKYRLEVVAFLNIPSDSDIYNIVDSSNKAAREAYVQRIISEADYTTEKGFSADDTLVLLSTCAYEYDEARYVVACKKVAW